MNFNSLNNGQLEAYKNIIRWSQSGDQTFYLGGFAGTGKTSLIDAICAKLGRHKVLLCAPTAKACVVISNKVKMPAQTLHSLLYLPDDTHYSKLIAARNKLLSTTDPDMMELLANVEKEIAHLKATRQRLKFIPRNKPIEKPFVICDEASMVAESVGHQLESWAEKIIYVGDPGQLPPVSEPGIIMNRNPDSVLTQVMRQGEGSGILDLATKMRNGGNYSSNSNVTILTKEEAGDAILAADQVIAWRNTTVNNVNEWIRAQIGFLKPLEVGDSIIFLKNDNKKGIRNGEKATVKTVFRDRITVIIDGPDKETKTIDHELVPAGFDIKHLAKSVVPIAYGYCITAHKSQGSEWDNVCIINEGCKDVKWCYTAVTRAKNKLTISSFAPKINPPAVAGTSTDGSYPVPIMGY